MNAKNSVPVARAFDVEAVRRDFPALHQQVHGHPLVYLDNAASAHKPRAVIDTITHYYSTDYSNVHRGLHYLSERCSQAYEDARGKVASFIHAKDAREIIFVRGTTEAINLVANTYGRKHVRAGDEILISALEHHSNIVPWQMLCEQTGGVLKVVPVSDAGELDLEAFEHLLSSRTRLVAVTHVSNALGTINPLRRIIDAAHAVGARVLIDGAQAVHHMPVDVQDLDCDFYAFSGHKMYGPTGIGVLYGKAALLEAMPPWQGGGEMIREVSFERSTYADIPFKFEAGTPHIVGAIGLGAAVDYISSFDRAAVARHEHELMTYATELLGSLPGLRIVGTVANKASIVSFVLDDAHPHDVGTILDRYGIAVRAGHHCTMPLMNRLCLGGTTRASFAMYNTRSEVERLVAGVGKVMEMFRR
ncbi:MAG: cysteine desulfurase [Chromatiales bacterium]|nr:cysteine desulfurase [Chromatiales bacterium]